MGDSTRKPTFRPVCFYHVFLYLPAWLIRGCRNRGATSLQTTTTIRSRSRIPGKMAGKTHRRTRHHKRRWFFGLRVRGEGVSVRVSVRACVRLQARTCVYVCVCASEGERMCVCVCMCMLELCMCGACAWVYTCVIPFGVCVCAAPSRWYAPTSRAMCVCV